MRGLNLHILYFFLLFCATSLGGTNTYPMQFSVDDNAFLPTQACEHVENMIKSRGTSTINTYSNDTDVTSIDLIWIDTTSTNVNLHGLQNGDIDGQRLFLVKVVQANNFVLKDMSTTGTEKIVTPDGNDITFANWGGAVLIFRAASTNWYVLSYSKQ